MNESTLEELRWKEIINVSDGTRYGYVSDLRIDLDSGQVHSLIVPGPARFFGIFGPREEHIIHWEDVRRFGRDIILVEGQPQIISRKKERRKFF